jgi:glucose uptake protein GlcU
MRIGGALVLVAVGAILKFAVTVHNTHGFNVNTAGVILMIVGAIWAIAEIIYMTSRRSTHVVQQGPVGTTHTTYTEPPIERY